ncbi:MAG: translesion DNA synthesis-associated protein ImuA [Rubrivivax sp.]
MEVSSATAVALAAAAPLPPSRAPGGGASSAGGAGVLPTLEDLHPALWRAHQLGRAREAACPSGYPELDAVLPGGGWPVRALTELLLPHAGLGEIRLVVPALAALQARQLGVMLFDPPALPFAWALGACGLDLQQLYVVRSRAAERGRAAGPLPAADVLWALEQSLKSGHLGAALAWLPARLAADTLRRLQLAAQAHDGPVFLLRAEAERLRPSPAPLRLLLHAAGPDLLRVQLLKRRGPPLAQPLVLDLPAVLPAPVLARLDRSASHPPPRETVR